MTVAMLSLALNLVLTGVFIMMVKKITHGVPERPESAPILAAGVDPRRLGLAPAEGGAPAEVRHHQRQLRRTNNPRARSAWSRNWPED